MPDNSQKGGFTMDKKRYKQLEKIFKNGDSFTEEELTEIFAALKKGVMNEKTDGNN